MTKIVGQVQRGKGLGKTIGYPTINVIVGDVDVEPGIYVCEVSIDEYTYYGAGYVGEQKEGEGKDSPSANLVCEVYLFDDCGDIYGEEVKIVLLKKIRDSVKVKNLDELKPFIKNDVEVAKNYLKMEKLI